MSNFSFLVNKNEYSLFANACIKAEEALEKDPNGSAMNSRRALESAIKWLYDKEPRLKSFSGASHEDNVVVLNSMINYPAFIELVGSNLVSKLNYIRHKGNVATHGDYGVREDIAVNILSNLFDFIQWIDKNYGKDYKKRYFDKDDIPRDHSTRNTVLSGVGGVVLGAGAIIGAILWGNKDKRW